MCVELKLIRIVKGSLSLAVFVSESEKSSSTLLCAEAMINDPLLFSLSEEFY